MPTKSFPQKAIGTCLLQSVELKCFDFLLKNTTKMKQPNQISTPIVFVVNLRDVIREAYVLNAASVKTQQSRAYFFLLQEHFAASQGKQSLKIKKRK